jgi:hypothetical protein
MKKNCYLLIVFLLCAANGFGQISNNCNDSSAPKVLLVGDSWAQYMGDDGRYNEVFNDYGFSDHTLLTETLGASPGPGYTGTAYAVSGSEAREWANTTDYPYIQNMVTALQNNPSINTVVLSIGGNDILAAKSGGGWYKDMDLDVAGSEQALFDVIEANTLLIVNAALAVRPDIQVLLSSYEYPNFNTGFFWCAFYACPKRRDLSRDSDNDLITDAELNGMMLTVEAQRQITIGDPANDRLFYDNSIGLMHHVYGDGDTGPGILPKPEGTAPFAPGGNPLRPSLRENFRISADPIHLDADGYEYKIQNQLDNYFFDRFREMPDETYLSEGGNLDGWVDVIANNIGTDGVRMGDDGAGSASNEWRGILSFDTGNLPSNAVVTGARLYLSRSSQGNNANPYSLNDRSPRLDIKSGTFGGASVEIGDGTATASANDVGCFHGDVAEDLDVTRIDIDPTYLTHINTEGRTQFRLMFDVADASANYINYYAGEEPVRRGGGTSGLDEELAPTIIYQEKTIEIENEDGTLTEMTIEIPAVAARGLDDAIGTTSPFLDLTFELSLPVALIQFTATAEKKQSLLHWATSSEEDFAGFHIERSSNGSTWQKIGFVAGQGQTQQRQDYQFVDPFPLSGQNYYRLNMLDQDDSQAYSAIRQLNFQHSVEAGWAYPNPFTNQLQVEISDGYTGQVHIQLYDLLGRSLQSWHFDQLDRGLQELSINAALPAGAYWLEVVSADRHKSTQVVKQ